MIMMSDLHLLNSVYTIVSFFDIVTCWKAKALGPYGRNPSTLS